MKKLVCLMLALALCISVSAMAEPAPSKTTTDLTKFQVTTENQSGDSNMYLLPINDLSRSDTLPAHKEQTDILQKEIAKLAAAGVDSYFASATDSQGKPVDLRATLGLDKNASLNVFEFCEVIASGFHENCGKVTATMLFPTPYAKNEKVNVLIGIVSMQADGTYTVAWQVFEGIGTGAVIGQETYGSIQVTFTPEVALAIENGTALLAVVSK